MLELVRLYVFDGIEHSPEDDENKLKEDAIIITESIANTLISVVVKSRNNEYKNKVENEELIKLVKDSGKHRTTIECQTFDFVVKE